MSNLKSTVVKSVAMLIALTITSCTGGGGGGGGWTPPINNPPPVTNKAPTARLTATPTSGTVPFSVSLNASGSSDSDGSVVSYDWDTDGNGSYDRNTSGPTISVNIATVGSVTMAVRVKDNGGKTAVATVTVTGSNASGGTNQKPDAVITNSIPDGAAPLMVTFGNWASDDPDGSIVLYEWDFDGDGAFEISSHTPSTTPITYTEIGTVTVKLRVTDNDGATDTSQITITVTDGGGGGGDNIPPSPVMTADITTGYAPVMTVHFDASASIDTDGSIVSYEWSPLGEVDAFVSGESTFDHTYDTTGTFYATVRVTDDQGAIGMNNIEITVLDQIDEGPVFEADSIPENHPPYCDWWFVNPAGDQTTSGLPKSVVYVQFEDSFDPDTDGAPKTARGITWVWVDVGNDGTWETIVKNRKAGEGTTVGPIEMEVTTQVFVKICDASGLEDDGDIRTFVVNQPVVPVQSGERPDYQKNIDWAYHNNKAFGTGIKLAEVFGFIPVPGLSIPIPVGYYRGMSHRNCIELGIASAYLYEEGYIDDSSYALKFLAVSCKHDPNARASIEEAGDAAVDYAVATYGPERTPVEWYLSFQEFETGGLWFNILREWGWIDSAISWIKGLF